METIEPYFSCPGVDIYNCSAEVLPLPDESIQTCVTSPPYWGLRDYGTAIWEGGDASCDHLGRSQTSDASTLGDWKNGGGNVCGKCGALRIDEQIGLEPTPEEYVAKIVSVMREVHRVLKSNGTLWLNLGDSYCSDDKWGGASGGKNQTSHGGGFPRFRRGKDCDPKRGNAALGQPMMNSGGIALKPKDLVGIPWMVAFALRTDGWYLRQDIIWHKPSPIPESVKDRCTKSHEYIFLLSKSPQYYFDADAIAEQCTESSIARLSQDIQSQSGSMRANGGTKTNGPMKAVGKVNGGKGFGKQNHDATGTGAQSRQFDRPIYDKRNKRSVWTVAAAGYAGAHFATFPPNLVEPCILAGSRKGETVLDPFSGTATVGESCQKWGRKFVGIELNPKYIELSKARFRQLLLV